MELVALTVGIMIGVVAAVCLGTRLRQVCLNAHAASLRDPGEHKYKQVSQFV